MTNQRRQHVLVSYSHRDKAWLERLQVHLRPALRYGDLDLWDDTRIKAGDRWSTAIREAIDRADVAILLVSADFLASDFITRHELPKLLEAADARGTVVIPVHVGYSLHSYESGLREFQAINSPSQPLEALKTDESEKILVSLAERMLELCRPKVQHQKRGSPAALLPRSNPDFVGRGSIIGRIRATLDTRPSQVVVLEGMGGIGKTTTGLAVAHDLLARDRFRDGALFINLEGFVDTRKPKTSEEALEELLRPLVGEDTPLPDGPAELQRLWREKTESLELLVFLDNAVGECQVEPLLTGNLAVSVLITSRNKLSLKGGTHFELQQLEEDAATQLAMDLANKRRANRLSASDAAKLTELCGHLPLAIEVTANTLSQSAGLDTGRFLIKLTDRTEPTHVINPVTNALGLSVEQLSNEDQNRWRQLGVFQGGFDRDAVADIWHIDDPDELLADFERRSLISYDETNAQYRLHDLLSALAFTLLGEDPQQKLLAEERHAQFFCRALRERTQRQEQAERPSVLDLLGYFGRNRLNIEAGQRWVIAQLEGKRPTDRKYVNSLSSRDRALWGLAADYGIGGIHLMISRHDARYWIRWLVPWIRATRILEDRAYLEPFAMAKFSILLGWLNRPSCAKAFLISAEELVNDGPNDVDPGIRAEVIANLSWVYLDLDEPEKALEYAKATRALKKDLARKRPEHRKHEAWSAGSIGRALHRLEGAASALPYYEEHRQLAHEIGNLQAENAAHCYLGSAHMELRNYKEAGESFECALEIAQILGQSAKERSLLTCMAAAAYGLGDTARACALMREADRHQNGEIELKSKDELLDKLQAFGTREWALPWRRQ